ncbi:MAG: 2Fe-2S iron-sulfur cluster-binding protein [Bacillota bacterium]
MDIDDREVPWEEGQTVLEAARRGGIEIPTLCHHPGLEPYGACRVCLVEIVDGGRKGLSASCCLAAADGLRVVTSSDRVLRARRVVVGFLLDRLPPSSPLRSLAPSLRVSPAPDETGQDDCVACGRCMRACAAVGRHAISFAWRGTRRRPVTPFEASSPDCVGCTACAQVCPTGAIRAEAGNDSMLLDRWKTRVPLVLCQACGQAAGPEPLLARAGDLHQQVYLCAACRRRHAVRFGSGWPVRRAAGPSWPGATPCLPSSAPGHRPVAIVAHLRGCSGES